MHDEEINMKMMKNIFSVFWFALALFVVNPVAAQIPSDGLVGYWPFTGNANDASGNGNNGTVNGATLTTDRFGNANSAYSFDGVNDFIDAGSFYNFGTANFTVSCWFKLVPTSANASLVSKREVNMQGNWWVQEVNGFQIDESALSSILTLTHPTPLNKQLWTNYIIIREGNILSFYVNGVLSDQETLPTAYNMSNNANLLFGTTFVDGSYVGLLKGKLDDISIYNRAIDSEEISSLFTTTTSAVATPPCPTLATNLQTGLVGYWPFCGNANDASGNGNHGTVNGATLTTDRFGNANSAYSFDGVNDWIEVANNPSITLTGDMTMSAWVKTNGSNGQNYQSIISKRETYWTWEYMMSLSYHSGIVHENKLLTARALGAGNQEQAWTEVNYSTSTWEYWTVAYSQGQVSLYKNGVLDHIEPFSMVPVSQNCPLLFGRNTLVDISEQFFGSIDDISIYNRALTPAEISQLYTNPSTTPPVACTPFLGEDQTVCAGTSVTLSASGSSSACPTLPANLQTGLVGYWPFCGNANDASGNGNNGTVNGATLTTDRFGNANSAYNFSRINSQDVSGSLTLSGNQFTESIWAKHNTGYTGNCSSPCNEWLISIGQYNPIEVLELGTYFNGNNLSTGKYNDILFQTQAVLSTSWTHYVVTHNNGMNTIYQDGVFKGSYSGAPINLTGNCGFYFGRQWDPYLEFWDGKLDDVSIYNRLLSIAEIQQLYTLGQTTYEWSTGDTTSTINVSPTTTTTYTCTVTTNGVSCTDSVTVTVQQPDLYYTDIDNDGFGAGTAISSCAAIAGYALNNTDCDDTNASINTAANEICNDIDDNCNSSIDEGLTFTDYYADLDNDGFGAGAATSSCVDLGVGYVTNNTDCDDTNANINTAASEICNDVDDNCNSSIDEGLTFTNYYSDLDNDGFGAGAATNSCVDLGAGYVTNNTDCDDTNGNTNPSAAETCNTIDDNCDGQIDEDVQSVYFIDSDGDTYGNPSVSILACTQPAGYTPDNTDCDDTSASINPAAEDLAGNGIDENCDGQIDNSIAELANAFILYPNPA